MFNTTPAGILWGALFSALLLAACVTDVRSRQIPNALVLAIIATGLAFSVATRPLGVALGQSALGLGLGFAIWIAFWLVGAMGAGDVKFFAAIGTWLGPALTWRAALTAALVGGVLAIAIFSTIVSLIPENSPIPIKLEPTVLLLALGFSAVVGIVFGIIPAIGASRKNPIDALRYE